MQDINIPVIGVTADRYLFTGSVELTRSAHPHDNRSLLSR